MIGEVAARLPSVSVIVPCYRYAHFLPGCLASVLSQEGVDVRVLVIDDASPDDTSEVATAIAAQDPRLEVRRHIANRGHIRTYNEGLEWVEGDYTVLLSADDFLVPGALARATGLMERNPGVGFVYGRCIFFSDDEPLPPARTGPGREEVHEGQAWLRRRCRGGNSVISSPEVVARSEMYQRWGGYRESLPHSGDIEMWMRFAAHRDVGYIAGADQAYYRVHRKSMQRGWLADPLAELRQRRAAYDTVFEHQSGAIPDAQELRSLAQSALAREALWRACRTLDRGLDAGQLADELERFAIETYPDSSRLSEHRSLRWRRRIAPRMRWAAMALVAPGLVRRRLQSRLWWHQWARHG